LILTPLRLWNWYDKLDKEKREKRKEKREKRKEKREKRKRELD